MPIRVQDELPAVNFLRNENVFVMTTTRNDSGNPPPEGVNPQPDAEENRDGKPVPASAIKLSAAGGYPGYYVSMRASRVIPLRSIWNNLLL